MKVWIKYLIGVALGIFAAFILPKAKTLEFITLLSELFIRVGRYMVVPLIFTCGICSIHKLRNSKLLLKSTLWTFLIIIAASLILTTVGLLSILIVKLPRIPITVENINQSYSLDVKNLIFSLFPSSAFDALREGSFLLVALIFAFLIGWESASDETAFKPVYSLSDSFSKLFYNISNFITEIMAICMVAITCCWIMNFRDIIAPGIFTPIIIMLAVDFVIVCGIIYPLILHFVCHDPHPYKVLYASIAPMILSFFTGDSNIVIPLLNRHGCESLGIRGRTRGFTYPLFSIFSRGGSALVVCISFITIWRSYSGLTLKGSHILWIFGISFLLSFLLGGLPKGGTFILLAIICNSYASGFETIQTSYLLLHPAALILGSFAALFDTVTAMYGSYIVAVKTKTIEHHSITHFI